MAGRPRRPSGGRGKSGLHEARVPGNARRGQPQGKRHREQTAPVPRPYRGEAGVRVKRWGKSPPRTGQPGRHGKPHPEQCRIGASRGKVRATSRKAAGDLRRDASAREARVGSLTPPVTAVAEEWSSKGGNPRNRIRLTGHPRIFRPPHPGPLPRGERESLPASVRPPRPSRRAEGRRGPRSRHGGPDRPAPCGRGRGRFRPHRD